MYNYPPTWNCGRSARNISDHYLCKAVTFNVRGSTYGSIRNDEHPSRQAQPLLLLSAARLVVVVAALLGPLGATSTAHADAADDKFLATLKREGITDHVSPAHAIEAGHKVCEKLEQGMTPTDVAYDVLNSSNLPAYHSGYFVGASIDAYCPRHKGEVPTQ